MRVLIVNTSEKTGGAAIAANRLMEALNNNGVKAKMLVRDKETGNINVAGLPQGVLRNRSFLWERLCIFVGMRFSRKHLFDVDIANAGSDITRLREFQEADVIHLHWINQGMLSLGCIGKILRSGKPVVWTMHDIWPATGICHLALGCKRFKTQCRRCKYLPGGGSDNDLSHRVWMKKKRLYDSQRISFVACSKWLAGEAHNSALLAGHSVTAIPNPIDTRLFVRKDKMKAREAVPLPKDKRLLFFVSQRVTNANKGMQYLIDACDRLARLHPEMTKDTAVVIAGGHAEDFDGRLSFPAYPLGYINDTRRLVDVYNAVDAFVLPSLSENLPNTIMEAMACGVPCIGFNTGGISEMIDHRKNGYVAEYMNADDLAEGIRWILDEADYAALCDNAVSKVASRYSQSSVAMKYIETYNQAIAKTHYKL